MTLPVMLTAGATAVARHRRIVAVVYLLQLVLSAAVGATVATVLAGRFARSPAFDGAMAGDLPLLLELGSEQRELIAGLAVISIAVALLYGVVSWFCKGGLLTLMAQPHTVVTTGAQLSAFGAAGTACLWPFAKLAAWSVLPYGLALIITLFGFATGATAAQEALTTGQLAGDLIAPAIPGLLLLVFVRTAMDYARVQLAADVHLASWRALARAARFTLTSSRTFVHVGIYYAMIGGVTAGYLALTSGRAMSGLLGLAALFTLRQLCASARLAAEVALMAGQVSYHAEASTPTQQR